VLDADTPGVPHHPRRYTNFPGLQKRAGVLTGGVKPDQSTG
jgi:hypothetical protein